MKVVLVYNKKPLHIYCHKIIVSMGAPIHHVTFISSTIPALSCVSPGIAMDGLRHDE